MSIYWHILMYIHIYIIYQADKKIYIYLLICLINVVL